MKLIAAGPPPKPGWGGTCTEVIAYLALHPRGVSSDQFADELWPDYDYDGSHKYPQNIASAARKWLGVDPRTGTEYMPWLSKSGVDSYRLDGLLVDVDLFRGLRARGVSRGAEGISDLVAALGLVSGRPFDRLRRGGYCWLEPGEDTLYEGMIEEVAHVVATLSLKQDDPDRAQWAAEVVLGIDPTSERALCDLAAAHAAAEREPELESTLVRLRSLEDITDRTHEVMRRHGWLAAGSR